MGREQPPSTATPERYPLYRWVIVALISGYQMEIGLVAMSLGILLPAIRKDLGLGLMQAGWLGSVSHVPQLVSILIALVVVRFNPRRVLVLGMIAVGIFILLQGWAPLFGILLAARFFHALSSAGMMSAQPLLWFQWIPRRQFATVMGLNTAATNLSQSIGLVLTPFLLVFLGGWRSVYTAYGFLILSMAFLWLLFGRQHITPEYRESMASREARAPLRAVLKYRAFTVIGLGVCGAVIPYVAFPLFWPTFLMESRGYSLQTAGFLIGLMPLGGLAASLSSGVISDWIGLRRPVIWTAGFMEPLMWAAMLLPVPLPWLGLFAFLAGYSAWMPVPAFTATQYELPNIKPPEVAVGRSYTSTITALGGIIGPILVGVIYQTVGSLLIALLVCALTAVTKGFMGLLLPETGSRAPRAGISDA